MIASTSSGKRFGPLATYLEVGRSGVEVDRVDWTSSRNLPTDEPGVAASLMQATAAENVRVEKPVYHLSVAFDPSDAVNRQVMEEVADRLLRDLELRDHQALLVAHRDREHPHVHIVVNRVHPESGLAWERWQDRPRIEETLRKAERDFGLREVPGRLHREPGHELPERSLDTPGERRAAMREQELSFADKVREHLPELRQAKTWGEFAERLAEHGFSVEPKGQGIVITDGTHHARASHVARDLSVNRLEERFDAPFPGRALKEPGREIDPTIRGIVRDLRSYDEVNQHRTAVKEAEAQAREISDHAYDLNRAARDWRSRSEDLSRDLSRVYRSPEEARGLIADFARTHGANATAQALREQPDAFGTLRGVERPIVLGFTRLDDTPARTEAARIPDTLTRIRESEKALRPLLDRADGLLTEDRVSSAQHAATVAVKSAEDRLQELHNAGRALPDRQALQHSIGEMTATLSRPELRVLRSFVNDVQAQVAFKLKEAVLELALGRERDHGREL